MDYPKSDPGSRLHNDRFTDGDAAQGIPPSVDKAAHQNASYDEIISAITAGGYTPTEGNNSQLSQIVLDIFNAISQNADGIQDNQGDISQNASDISLLKIATPKSQITFHYVDLNDPDPVPGWLLCDGSGGTPDMRDRFIISSGAENNPGDIGGSTNKTTSSNGSHSHSVTVNNRTLSQSQMPSHYHEEGMPHDTASNAEFGGTETGADRAGHAGGDTNNSVLLHTSTEGGNVAHNHTASSGSSGSHSHSVDVRPKYFALAPFILASYVAELNA